MREPTLRHLGRAHRLQIASFSFVSSNTSSRDPLSEGERKAETRAPETAIGKIRDRRRKGRKEISGEGRRRPVYSSQQGGREGRCEKGGGGGEDGGGYGREDKVRMQRRDKKAGRKKRNMLKRGREEDERRH